MEESLQTLSANQRLAEWGDRISTCRYSGMSVRNWCREHGISEKTYYYWQRRVFQAVTAQQISCFAEVPLMSRSDRPEVLATLRLGGMEADIYTGANAAAIETICRVLKSC